MSVRMNQPIVEDFKNSTPKGWKKQKLSEMVLFIGGNAFKSTNTTEDGIKWLKIANVGFGKVDWSTKSYLPLSFSKSYSKYLLSEDDVVMALTRPILGDKLKIAKVRQSDTPALLNQRVAKLVPNEGYDLNFLYYILSKRSTVLKIENAIAGTDPPNLGFNDLKKVKVIVPTNIVEQQKIASILSTWDKAIELKEKLIEQKKEQKKGLMQKLLTGEVRFPGYDEEWIKIKIGKLIGEISEKSTVNNQYEVLSVTKNGIVSQNEHFKKQVASENNVGYKVIRKNNLVFSTMNLWMGSLDVLTDYEIGIVSPAYKVFEFKLENIIPSFAKFYMLSEHMIWLYNVNSEQGASIVRRNLDLKALLNTIVKVPPIQEQQAISKVLIAINNEIILLENELELLKQQKQGLMQLLLTGKVRVKV